MSELASGQEKSADGSLHNFLNGAGNHELKLLTTAVVLSHPDSAYTASNLYHEMIDRQGEVPVWKFQYGLPGTYCDRSLEPIGAVVVSMVDGKRGRQVKAYQANPEHRKVNLARTGFLLDWSLENTDLSLQHVYGATTSAGNVRSPQVRHQIYEALLTGNEGDDITSLYDELEGAGYNHRANVNAQLERMEELGLLVVESHKSGFDPKVHIDTPEYEHSAIPLADTLPETQALYAALRKVGAGKTLSVNQLISKALELNPDINTSLLRKKLINALRDKGYPGLRVVDPGKVPMEQHASVVFDEDARGPISDLCEGLTRIEDGKGIARYRTAARTIIGCAADFAKLTAKAQEFSPSYAGREVGRDVLEGQLEALLQMAGTVTIAKVRDELFRVHERRISTHMLRAILRGMARQGRISVSSHYKDPHSKVESRAYGPVTQN